MSTTTTNYALKKIDLTDTPPDITVLNSNFDTIDAELKTNKTTADGAIPKNIGTAADQVAVSSGVGAWAVKTLAQFKTWLGLGSAAYTSSTAYATATQGSTADTTATTVTTHLADVAYQVAGGTATALTLTTATLADGYTKTFIANATSASTSKTINGKPFYKPGTTSSPSLTIGKAYTVWYNLAGDRFFIKASAEGTATTAQVLAGVSFSNGDDIGLIGVGDVDLIPANILSGKNIFGVAGNVIAGKSTATGLGTFVNNLGNMYLIVHGLSFRPTEIVVRKTTLPYATLGYSTSANMGTTAMVIYDDGFKSYQGESFGEAYWVAVG